MKLLVDAPAYWQDESTARAKAWLYLASCKKFGIEPVLYGVGSQHYVGEAAMRVDGQIEVLKAHSTSHTHVLFTDAWDVIFLEPLAEIVRRYREFGSPPCLNGAAAACQRQELAHHFDQTVPYPYITPAMYIGEIPYMLEVLTRMQEVNPGTHDQTPGFIQGWIEGWFSPVIDHDCKVFGIDDENYGVLGGRVHNMRTGSYPCVFHADGRVSTNPDTGRDAILEPWAIATGVLV